PNLSYFPSILTRPPRSTLFPYTTLFRSIAAPSTRNNNPGLASISKSFQPCSYKSEHASLNGKRGSLGCSAPGSPYPRLQRKFDLDRKSTRLNSSHSQISYAVFCLKKKKK